MIRVTRDPTRVARILSRTPLRYAAGPDVTLDRPAHVRAASALAWVDGRLAILQDDANFIAFVEPGAGGERSADSLVLPAGPGGLRQFDETRGNKSAKLDLESCVTLSEGSMTTLVAFGSGSSRARERVLIVRFPPSGSPGVELIPAPAFYSVLRSATAFAGSELNIEGAVLRSAAELRLFGRGNGAPRDGAQPVNGVCSIDWLALRACLHDSTLPAPKPHAIHRYDLGTIDGVPLGFTDAMAWNDDILFSAAAEASPDAVADGRVAGSAIGVIPSRGTGWSMLVVDEDGAPFVGKIEGLANGPDDSTLYAVADEDDPTRPSELCLIAIERL